MTSAELLLWQVPQVTRKAIQNVLEQFIKDTVSVVFLLVSYVI